MKKRLIGLSILMGLSLLVAACGGGDDTSVYVVFDIGGRGDQSFNDAAAAGLDLASEELGVTSSELEPTAGGENRDELLNLAADDGAQLVFGVGFLFTDAIAAAADAYPETDFALIDGFVPISPPIATLLLWALPNTRVPFGGRGRCAEVHQWQGGFHRWSGDRPHQEIRGGVCHGGASY